MLRTRGEWMFLGVFLPCVVLFYLVYKYPLWFVDTEQDVVDTFFIFGKSLAFWYATVYTAIVCVIAGRVVLAGITPYGRDKQQPLSSYQRRKFTSIFFAQLVFFYLIPFVIPDLVEVIQGKRAFFADTYEPLNKDAYVYVYNGFTSVGGFFYVFILVPLTVWFLGKRYCSWFCACGNLAEVIGVTGLGNRWVRERTPRSAMARKAEWLQYLFLGFALVFGLVMFLHAWNIIVAPDMAASLRVLQDLCVDLIFGALIGIGAYPFLGTRIWCRYGCPLAGLMRIFGKITRSRFAVVAHSSCKGLNLCSTQCPMGIDVASYAHKDGRPIQGRFGLQSTPCIGCGGCVDICPVKALSFQKILAGKGPSSSSSP